MNVMDIKHLFSHNLNLLLPKSNQIIKNLGKRKPLPTITPRERSLIIKKPKAYKHSYLAYVNSGEFSIRTKEKDLQKLKKLIDRSLSNEAHKPNPSLPTIKKNPQKAETKNFEIKGKIMITTFKRFKGSKLNPKKQQKEMVKEKESDQETYSLLNIVNQRSQSGNSVTISKGLSESDEDRIEFDENINYV